MKRVLAFVLVFGLCAEAQAGFFFFGAAAAFRGSSGYSSCGCGSYANAYATHWNWYPNYSGYYVTTPNYAGWHTPTGFVDYPTYWSSVLAHPTWGLHNGYLYDKRLYREPPGGWENRAAYAGGRVREVWMPLYDRPPKPPPPPPKEMAESAPKVEPPKRCSEAAAPPATKPIPQVKDSLKEWKRVYSDSLSQVDDGTIGNSLRRLEESSGDESLDVGSDLLRIAPIASRDWE